MPELEAAVPLTLKRRIPLAQIDSLVSGQLGPTRVPGNAQPAAFNRQMAMYLAKRIGGWSTRAIGRFYNGRDHSTVCYAIQRIEALREINSEVEALLTAFENRLKAERYVTDTLSIKRPTAVRVDKLRDDMFLDQLADRIASRLARLLEPTLGCEGSDTESSYSMRQNGIVEKMNA